MEGPTSLPFSSGQFLYIDKMPKATQKSSSMETETEVIEIEDKVEMEVEPPCAINSIEARCHVQRLNEAIQMMEAKIDGGEIKDILKDAVQEIKEAICIVMPSMSEGNVRNIQ